MFIRRLLSLYVGMFFDQLKSIIFRSPTLEDSTGRNCTEVTSAVVPVVVSRETSTSKGKPSFNAEISNSLSSIVSPHGVPSMVKSLEACLLILRIAQSADPRLNKNHDVHRFFEFLSEVARSNNRVSRQGFQGLKVLCIEGLPGSGKSTLVEGLVSRAGAILIGPMLSPSAATIRSIFSGSPEPVQIALSFALNYCTAHRIITEVAAAPDATRGRGDRLVVVDEFYHSVCARTVCTNVPSGVDLKSLPASAFEWPLDLPTPSLVCNITYNMRT